MKPTGRYWFCLFHSQDPKPKRNHQIAISRTKIRSRLSQTCVKYRGNIICIKRKKTDVNTSAKKNFTKNVQIKLIFQTLSSFSPKKNVFFLPPMHGWRAMDVMVHLAPIYQGHSVSVQCYEFGLHAILLM